MHVEADEGTGIVSGEVARSGRRSPLTWARVGAGWIAGAAILAWLTRGIDWRSLVGALRPAPAWAWAAAVVGLAASYAFRALRMQAELSRRGPVRFGECLEVMLLHNAAVNIVPMRGGEAAYPVLVHRRLGVAVAGAVGSLVWMRVQDALLLALAAAALWPGLPAPVRLGVAAAVVAGTVTGLGLLERAARWSAAADAPRLVRALQAGLRALAAAPRHGVRGWIFCAASWTVKLGAIGGLVAALAGLDPARALPAALGGELAGVLPVQGPAGFGTYEAGVWAGSAVGAGVAAPVAAAALAVHALSLSTALAGGALAHVVSLLRGPRGRAEAP